MAIISKAKSNVILKKRWECKRDSIYNLRDNINRLKRKVSSDLYNMNEKELLTALVIRIMFITSERVGNEESATNCHFGITQLKNKHVTINGKSICLRYVGKSGVKHEKCFIDERSAILLNKLKYKNKDFIFVTQDGFKIKPDRVNRYLADFGVKSKDIRGYNANRMVVMYLSRFGKVSDEKQRVKIFNECLRKVSEKIGHGASTLRTHYLLPEIESNFYTRGSVGKINL